MSYKAEIMKAFHRKFGRNEEEPTIHKVLGLIQRERGNYFSNDSLVLDNAMGNGFDISQIKLWYPKAEVFGIDRNIIMPGESPEDLPELRSDAYRYEDARKIVRKAFGRDMLPKCHVFRGDARELDFESEYFSNVISLGLIHHQERGDRIKSFAESYRVLRKGGKSVWFSNSGEGLKPFSGMKKYYDWKSTRQDNRDESLNPDFNPDEYQRLKEDILKICGKYGITPIGGDWRKLERVAAHSHSFFIEDLDQKTVSRDLKNIGYKAKVYQMEKPQSIFKYLLIEAEK